MKNDYYYQVLTDVKDYRLTFPDYVQSISLTQNDFGSFADLSVSGSGIGYNLQMQYSSDPPSNTFSGVVSKGEYSGSKVTITTSKTWSFDGKDPEGATKIHAELKLKNSGLFSALTFVSDDSIKFGFQQALDKIGDRAKVIQQSSGSSQLVTTPPQSTTQPITPVTTQPPVTTNIPKPTPTPTPTPIPQPIPKPPIVTPPPQPTSPITQPSPKLPIITLYSSTVNGMAVTIYGNAQSGSGKTLSNILLNWGDGQTSTGQFPQTHTYSQSGAYTVTATVIDIGLSSSVTTDVVISAPAQPPQQTQPQPTVTVKTDLSSYKTGDTIVITGHVTNLNSATVVTLRIVSPEQKIVLVDQLVPSSDGSFVRYVTASGSLWQPSGTFTVIAQYGSADIVSQTTFSFTTISQSSSVPITNTSYTVSPSTYIPIPFSLSCSASVTGAFSAHAALGNNIWVFVFDQDNFQKYQNHNAYIYQYYNEQTGTGTFILNLTPGNYYIVLSNTYSVVSTKNVDLQASYTCN